jgi:hypothetical protein
MPKTSDCKIALLALIAFAAWLYVGLPLLYSPYHLSGELLGVKYGEWLLFLATAWLAWGTWRLVEGADKTAERQLRAYVLLETTSVVSAAMDGTVMVWPSDTGRGGQSMPIQAGHQPMAIITFKNFGRTPAHDVEMFGNVAIVPWPIRQEDLPELDLGTGTREIIGPGGTRRKHELFAGQPHPITPQEWAGLTNGTHALVFFGEVRYVDAFNETRITRYRLFCGGEMWVRGLELSAHSEGNSYT